MLTGYFTANARKCYPLVNLDSSCGYRCSSPLMTSLILGKRLYIFANIVVISQKLLTFYSLARKSVIINYFITSDHSGIGEPMAGVTEETRETNLLTT